MTGEPDGKTRRRLATRERLFRAAVELFVTRGYDTTTMDDIAVAAGVARRTAFNHFPAKADIAVEWAVRRGDEAAAVARGARRPGESVPDRVRTYFHELAVLTERSWDETRQFVFGWLRGYGSAHHRSLLSGELRDWLHEWLRDRPANQSNESNEPSEPNEPRLGESADPALIAEVLYDVFQGALLRWMRQQAPEQGRFTAEVDAAIALVLAGLGREAGPGRD